MRRGPKGQLIVHPWSPMHTDGSSLALVLETQQQGQKLTKILQELPCLFLSIDISSLGKRASSSTWDFSAGLLSHFRSERLWWFVSLNMFFSFTFLLMMLKKGVSTQRKMYLSLHTALVSGSNQAAAWNWLEKLMWLVLLLVFWGRKKLPALITDFTQRLQSHKERNVPRGFPQKPRTFQMGCLKVPSLAWPYPVSQGPQWLGRGDEHHLFLGVRVGILGCSIPWEMSVKRTAHEVCYPVSVSKRHRMD